MKTVLLQVGKTNQRGYQAIISDYAERLKHYCQFEIITIPELKGTKALSQEQQKKLEASLILKQITSSDFVVLLDERGKELSSTELASWIEKKQQSAIRRLVFVIGGPYGFASKVYDRADEKLSLSRMTFSHQMVRMIFIEQLYRAFTIIKGEHYHHS